LFSKALTSDKNMENILKEEIKEERIDIETPASTCSEGDTTR
jgi:hypothetical protein